MIDYRGEKFLDKLYSELYVSNEVKHTKTSKDSKEQGIRKYLNRIEEAHLIATNRNKKEILKRLYYDKYVIKEENINNSLTKKEKQNIISIQRKSLSNWIDYLTEETTYPMWIKYWIFQGMLKIGTYDEVSDTYQKRSEKTTSKFIDVNPEIIAHCVSYLMKCINKEKITDEDIKKIVLVGNFSKLYNLFEKEYKKNIIVKSNSNDGVWIKYNQGNKEDANKLCESLQNKNTGWCTAAYDIALVQICGPYKGNPHGGDFYVYYTKDDNNEYKMPRIAIRMENKDRIGEIRGIGVSQSLEEDMKVVLEEKLREMTFIKEEDIKENLNILDDIKELTTINKKIGNNIELTNDEINDLYSKKFSFGLYQDEKVDKIISKRNILDDMKYIKDTEKKADAYYKYIFKITTKQELESALDVDKFLIEYASFDLRSDKNYMLELTKKYSFSFAKFVSDELKDDEEYIIESCKYGGMTLLHASDRIKDNINVVKEAIKTNPYSLAYASINLQINMDLLRQVIKIEPSYFSNVLKDKINIKDFKELTLLAVSKNGLLLKYAGELNDDDEVVQTSLKQNILALEYASDKYKSDRSFALDCVKKQGKLIAVLDEKLQNDDEIIFEALNQDLESKKYIPKEKLEENDIKMLIERLTPKEK